ncbi:MAG: T9SS type A sorting domain-containing protein [Bacteroidia bacterium]|nr:T9SS type A sorting domain-containing protein [Bacteroidia bacterium]
MLQKLSISLLAILVVNSVQSQDWAKKMNDPSVNFYDVQSSFNTYWKKEERKEKLKKIFQFSKETEEENEGFVIYKRWEHFVEQRVFPSGDRSLIQQGSQELERLINDPTYRSAMQAGGNWHLIGATNVPTSGGGAGRLNCVEFHPTNPNVIFVGAPAGGLWRSNDGGNSWSTTTDKLPSIGVNDVAIDPQNPNTIYIATGDDDGGDTYSVGVLKSVDGGVTWQMTGLNFATIQSRKISRVLVNPNDPNIVFAGTTAGIYRSTNAGLTWTKVHNANPVKDMEFKPGDPSVVYATTSKSFYRSTNSGATFTIVSTTNGLPAASNVGRLAIAVTPADPNYVYLIATEINSNGFYGFYRSTNQGQTFMQQANFPNLMGWDSDGMDSGGQGWYDLAIAASPSDKDEVVVGGVNVWRSYDGGLSWQIMAHWYGGGGAPYVHADIHDLNYRPGTPELYVGCDGGIFRTLDGGSSFDDLSDGLQIAQMYRMGAAATNANITIQGWQDNGTNLQTGTNWERVIGGDGMECFVDWSNANYMYGELYYGDIERSSNGGASFNSIKNNISEEGEWVTPWLQDPINPQTLYAGYDNVWKTTNRGNSWTKISSFNSNGLTSLAVAPSNPQYIYASDGSALYVTSNGGTSWTSMSPMNLGGGTITYIAVSTTDPSTLWITRSGYVANNKVFKSTDAGQTWTNVSGNLPNIPANCIVYQNGTNDGLYVGTDVGVYYKDNTMNSWMPFSNGLPNTIINELEIHYGSSKLRAATYGRGLWETSIYNPSSPLPFANFSADTLAGCPGLTVQFSDSTLNSPTAWLWSFPGGTPSSSTLQNPVVVYNTPGTYNDVKLVVTNANGVDSVMKYSYIAISPQTQPQVSLNNNDSLCAGQVVQLTSSFGNLYNWYPTGQPLQTINSNSTNNYAVTVTDIFGCSSVSDTVRITVFPLPATPVISMSNDTLFSSSIQGNQWYMNGSLINGATDSILIITDFSATYSVQVTDAISGCSSTSSNFVGVEESTSIGVRYSVYPNPASDQFHLVLYAVDNVDMRVELTDVSGKLLMRKEYQNITRIEDVFELSNYEKGMYLLTLQNNKGTTTQKIVKY